MKNIITILLLLAATAVISQTKCDDVKNIIDKGNTVLKSNLDSAFILFQSALKLASKNNCEKYKSTIIGEIGKTYYYKNEVDSAKKYFIKSLKISEKNNDFLQVAKMSNNLGLINLYTQKYAKALAYFTKQLKYSIKTKDSIWISDSYNNFGTYYLSLDSLDKAVEFYNKAIRIATIIDYKGNIASINTNLAIVFHTKANLPLALKYGINAAKTFKEIGDLHNYSLAVGNIGSLHLDNYDYKKAKKYLLEAYNLKDSIVIEDYYLKTNLINLGIVFIHFSEYDKAEEYLTEALKISKKNEDIKSQITIYHNFVTLFVEKNEKDKALSYAQKSLTLSKKIKSAQSLASSYKNLGKAFHAKKKLQTSC